MYIKFSLERMNVRAPSWGGTLVYLTKKPELIDTLDNNEVNHLITKTMNNNEAEHCEYYYDASNIDKHILAKALTRFDGPAFKQALSQDYAFYMDSSAEKALWTANGKFFDSEEKCIAIAETYQPFIKHFELCLAEVTNNKQLAHHSSTLFSKRTSTEIDHHADKVIAPSKQRSQTI